MSKFNGLVEYPSKKALHVAASYLGQLRAYKIRVTNMAKEYYALKEEQTWLGKFSMRYNFEESDILDGTYVTYEGLVKLGILDVDELKAEFPTLDIKYSKRAYGDNLRVEFSSYDAERAHSIKCMAETNYTEEGASIFITPEQAAFLNKYAPRYPSDWVAKESQGE